MKTIIAHKDIVVRKKLRQIIERKNFEVVDEASNGLQAYNKYVEYLPELIFLNIKLPIYDGISALNRIKTYNPNALCVMMGEHFNNREIFNALEVGAVHYLELPIEYEKVSQLIEDINIIKDRME